MATIEADIQAALFEHLAELSLSPSLPVAWPNTNFSVPTSKKYLEVRHFPNTTERPWIGSSEPHLHQGILQVTVHWPLNANELPAREIAGLVASHFPPDFEMASGVRVTKRPDVSSALVEETDIQIPVSIRYRVEA